MRPICGSAGKALVYVVLHTTLHLRLLSMMAIPCTHLFDSQTAPFSPSVCVSFSLRVLLQTAQPRQISNFAWAS